MPTALTRIDIASLMVVAVAPLLARSAVLPAVLPLVLGGKAFGVLLPGSDKQMATGFGQRLRARLQHRPWASIPACSTRSLRS